MSETPISPRDVFRLTACRGKEAYASPQLAHRRLAEMKRKGKRRHDKKLPTRVAYRCSVCHQWHLGSV